MTSPSRQGCPASQPLSATPCSTLTTYNVTQVHLEKKHNLARYNIIHSSSNRSPEADHIFPHPKTTHQTDTMARGETVQVKVHYKGKDDDFLVFLDSVEDFNKWKGDKSVPLAQVVSSFKIFVTHKRVFCVPFFPFSAC